ncbi:hypothetical protein GCM10010412_058970 [Nonomuraea recticatena]|uniref:GNAT family N-acetyltransferase n=1 Tax=Nonomuraea recticatena TaxID=46178 RepID=A0ABP6EVH2_9ACTN
MDASAVADERHRPERQASRPEPGAPLDWAMRPAEMADVETIAELRATVLRDDLERLGRFDEHRVRQRLRDSFSSRHTLVITVGGAFAGCVTLRRPRTDTGSNTSTSLRSSRVRGSVPQCCAASSIGLMPRMPPCD